MPGIEDVTEQCTWTRRILLLMLNRSTSTSASTSVRSTLNYIQLELIHSFSFSREQRREASFPSLKNNEQKGDLFYFILFFKKEKKNRNVPFDHLPPQIE